MKWWKSSAIIRMILGLLLVPGIFLDVLGASYISVGRSYVSTDSETEREFFLRQESTEALLDGYIRLYEEYMHIGTLITEDGDIDYDREILYSVTGDKKYTIKELLRQSRTEGTATEILQDFMKNFTQHSLNGESYPWRIERIVNSDTRVVISGEDILFFHSPNVKSRTGNTIRNMKTHLSNMIPITTDDKTFQTDFLDDLSVDMDKQLHWEYNFHAKSQYEEYIISYFRKYAECYFLEQLLDSYESSESGKFQAAYDDYCEQKKEDVLSEAKFAAALQEEYQTRYDRLADKDIPWKTHLIPETMNEAKKYVTFLVETYQQLTYLFARTNFFYVFENSSGLLMTNRRDTWNTLVEQLSLEDRKALEDYAYIYYDRRVQEGKTNLGRDNLPMSGNTIEKLKTIGDDFRTGTYQIAVGIDLNGVWNQVWQDEFVEQYQDSLIKCAMYENGKMYGIIGMILTLFALFFLFLRSGTPVGGETSALYFVDKIWLEAQLLFGVILLQMLVWLTHFFDGYSEKILLLFYSIAMTILLLVLIMLFFSIVKRMKLHQTGKYCILALFVKEVLIGKLSMREFGRNLYRRFSMLPPGKKFYFCLFAEALFFIYFVISAGWIYYSRSFTVRKYFHSVYGGIAIAVVLLFGSILILWQHRQMQDEIAQKKIILAVKQILSGDFNYVLTQQESAGLLYQDLTDIVNQIGTVLEKMVDENVKNERMKTELIANVSHDIKTPLTSIINYVDILQGEDITGKQAKHYLQILDQKSQRLKLLIEDLIEASKASSGAIELRMDVIDFRELVCQVNGEFDERFASEDLELITELTEHPVYFEGDGRHVFRVLENLYGNVAKYAMKGSRVYVRLEEREEKICFMIKNISAEKLNITPEELTERFVRGDHSRSTEGSGLGLSIAKSLTELMDGTFVITVDGDLFCSEVCFPIVQNTEETLNS